MNSWDKIHEKAIRIVSYLMAANEPDTDSLLKEEKEIAERSKRIFQSSDNLKSLESFDHRRAYLKLVKRNRAKTLLRFSPYAAAILLVAASLYFLLTPQKQSNDSFETLVSEIPIITPGEKKARLILDDGREIDLEQTQTQILEQNGSIVSIDTSGVKYLSSATNMDPDIIAYNTLDVPRGGEFFLTLEDGTNVWLNAGSKLRYPITFSKEMRSVHLEGEAYFEVSKDITRQFIVTTTTGEITVLGTSFNVKGYSEDKMVYTTLAEGSVSFRETGSKEYIILAPGQQLSYNAVTGSTEVQSVNIKNYISWKDKLFTFEELTLEEIMTNLSRWYDVEVTYESNDLRKLLFSGNLDKYSNINAFFNLFEAGANIRFEADNKKIIIKKGNNVK